MSPEDIRRALEAEADRQELADREKNGTNTDPLNTIRERTGGNK